MAVQGNVPRAGLDFNAERRRVLDNHVSVTISGVERERAAGAPTPDLVVWPENAADIDPVSYTHLRAHETVLDLVCRLLLDKKQHQHKDEY